MSQDNILSINPNKQKIYKWFFPLPLLDDETKIKISAWEKIPESDYQFLKDIFLKRNMKVSLDDVSFIFNYFKFLKTVPVNEFNSDCENLDKALIQMWPLIQALKNDKQFLRIFIQLNVNGVPEDIEISSDKLLLTFTEVFKGALRSDKFWKRIQQQLSYYEETNQIQSFIKGRTGNRINYVKTVIQQSVTMLKGYLKEFDIVENTRPHSVHTIIGEILEKVGIIDTYANQTHYKTESEYLRKKAYDLDMDNACGRTPNLFDEMFPPHFLIQLNKDIIV